MKIIITAAVLLLAGAIIWHKYQPVSANRQPQKMGYKELTAPSAKPKMVDIGSTTCVPCQEMEKVIHTLREKHSAQLEVYFIDTEFDSQSPVDFKIKLIPTQIFLGTDGKEFFRHEGYYPLEEIRAMLKEHGINLEDMGETTETEGGLFDYLTKAMSSGWALPLLAAFIWGILSIILSPCHLASIPLIIAFIDQQGEITTRRAAFISTLFSGGILITIALIGVATAIAGSQLGNVGSWSGYMVAGIFILIGLYLLDIVKNPFNGPGQIRMQKRGALAAFILGLVFGLALGPCTFAYLAPVLAVAFKSGAENMIFSILILLIYAVGHCSVIILAGTFTESVQHYLNWNEKSKATVVIKKICAVLVILGGYYMLFKA